MQKAPVEANNGDDDNDDDETDGRKVDKQWPIAAPRLESRCRRLICQIPPANDYYYYNADADADADADDDDADDNDVMTMAMSMKMKSTNMDSFSAFFA